MEYQVRVAKIEPGELERFIEERTATTARLRRRHGFTIVGAWVVADADEFIWILGYEGDRGFARADADFAASEDRRALDPDPARMIVSTDHHMARRIV